jgi:hypothetical protein
MKKYISKKDEWFDEGTEAQLIDDYMGSIMDGAGLFRGIKDGKLDEEICLFEEFDIIDDEPL